MLLKWTPKVNCGTFYRETCSEKINRSLTLNQIVYYWFALKCWFWWSLVFSNCFFAYIVSVVAKEILCLKILKQNGNQKAFINKIQAIAPNINAQSKDLIHMFAKNDCKVHWLPHRLTTVSALIFIDWVFGVVKIVSNTCM